MMESNYQQNFDKGVEHFRNKQYESSLQCFSEVIASFSEKYAPYLNRGTIFLQLSLLSQALADFNRAIEIDPRDPTAYYNRAIVRMKENRLEDALSDLFVALSCMYLQKGIQTREIKYLTKAISLVDNNVYAHIERGKLYNIQGNYVLAENDFSSAVELDPSNSEAYALRGSLYRDLKQEENATKDLKQVLALTQQRLKNEFKLDPRLKSFTDAQLNQELFTKLKEIADMRNAQVRSSSKSEVTSKELIQITGDIKKTAKDASQRKAKQDNSEELLIEDRLDKGATTNSKDQVDEHSNSRVDDSYVIEDKIGKIETEIEKCRQQMIEQGNTSSVFDSRLDDNMLQLSNPLGQSLMDKSKDEYQHHATDTHRDVDMDNVISSVDMQTKHNIENKAETIAEDKLQQESQTTPITTQTKQQAIKLQEESIGKQLSSKTAEKEDFVRGKTTLQLEIVAATLTHSTELFGSMSPFCIVTYNGQPKQTQIVSQGGKNPVWNDKLFFPLKQIHGQAKIVVWDKQTLKNDDLIGEGILSIDESTTKCTLQFDGKPAGQVYVRIRLL